jgi:hypothetical protein
MLFHFTLSDEYVAAQRSYEARVAAADPQLLQELLAPRAPGGGGCPYHVDTLLALAEYQQTTGAHEAAARLLRQALYVLESAWHPSFKPWQRRCQLVDATGTGAADNNHMRDTFLGALFRYAKHAGRVGAPRAAFEACKLLLQLGGGGVGISDRHRVLFLVDFYGIRAKQLQAVIDMTNAETTLRGSNIPAAALPNFAYSRALAAFLMEMDGRPASEAQHPPTGFSAHQAGQPLYSDASWYHVKDATMAMVCI